MVLWLLVLCNYLLEFFGLGMFCYLFVDMEGGRAYLCVGGMHVVVYLLVVFVSL